MHKYCLLDLIFLSIGVLQALKNCYFTPLQYNLMIQALLIHPSNSEIVFYVYLLSCKISSNRKVSLSLHNGGIEKKDND